MKFNTKLAVSAALLCAAGSAPAMAQDAFTGPYVSVFGGGTKADDRTGDRLEFDTNRDGVFNDNVNTVGGANAFSPGFCDSDVDGNAPPCNKDGKDWEYGARIGYDMRPGGMALIGTVLEVSRTELADSTTGFSTTPASYTVTREMDYAVSARARFGWVFGETVLAYATGGVSYADIDQTFTTTNGANSFTEVNDDKMRWGWQAGGGMEFALTPALSLGAEYLYSDYGDGDYYVEVGPGTAGATNPFLVVDPTGTDLRSSNGAFRTHSLRATATLRF
ncbi:outer membrane beta-barrel protein [Altererythrobacter sp. KTW20L]|uniref:outer membrane protein n=1 Tax=Altererythrobacter sp. KTW20L TaxID=2942210 RepID=UPI0020BF0930|nr:outer membrane beta-barrel protein [Altererythrobacter sp. KTW20L]MCL6249488.1 outer membrane beta-barrel protein [Altererythrobacter sp. KTW20L]